MPRSKRDEIKRRLDSVINHQNKSITQMVILHDMFFEHHPEYSKYYEGIIKTCNLIISFVEKIKEFI